MDRRWTLAGGLALVSVVAGIWFGRGVTTQPAPLSGPVTTTSVAASEPSSIYVHVSGWVAVPGLVRVPAGSRLADAVAAAGGVRPGGSLDRLNLAQSLVDGEQVRVPGPGEEPSGGPVAAGESGGPIRLNVASAAELESLPGIGPVLAGRIVAHRQAHGPFRQVEDLLAVAGIGEAKLAAIRDLVTVP